MSIVLAWLVHDRWGCPTSLPVASSSQYYHSIYLFPNCTPEYASIRSCVVTLTNIVGVDGMTNRGPIPRWSGEFRCLTNVKQFLNQMVRFQRMMTIADNQARHFSLKVIKLAK